MADAVAIVSVATSGAVGIAGISSTAWNAARGRKWQAREERLAELRDVLDAAAAALARSLRALFEANNTLSAVDGSHRARGQVEETARERVNEARDAEAELWSIVNRVQVRTGSASPIATALERVERRVEDLHTYVETLSKPPQGLPSGELDFEQLWVEAKSAENNFYDIAEATLWPAGVHAARRDSKRSV